MLRLTAVVLAGLLGLTATGCTQHTDASAHLPKQVEGALSTSTASELSNAVTSAMTLAGASGAIVGVWAPWAGSWTATPGTTAISGSVPMTSEMHFRIASNTTSMTCTVLLALADEGTVALDDLVTKYLPRMTNLDLITLGDLCRNTSGLGDYVPALEPQFVNNPRREWPALELLTDGMAAPRTGTPGEKFSYSNAGIVLLGIALQTVTGKSLDELYRSYIFNRLGMSETSLPATGDHAIPQPHPLGYATALDAAGAPLCGTLVDETLLSPSVGGAAGGAVSSLSDMKTYVEALATGALVSKKSSAAQWTTIPLGGDVPSWEGYGLGVMQFGPLRGYDGEIPGFISAMVTDPKTGLTVVVVLNNSTSGRQFARTLALQLASIASKAPARTGSAPVIALPWSAQQAADGLKGMAVCPPATPAK
ncbi:MAG: D-alanyl-D-alanine carboxypeptidase [Microbacteriaceae bacterium]|nr:D-alanyl-D-alanine carboxypeptidase [Microbacteriaceae bacterium]